jgi:phage terminase Nu1 subunit (DNA packaging protein)
LNIHKLTTEEVAGLLLVTERAVRKWAKDESLPHGFEGKDLRFDWPKTLTWWLNNKYRGAVAKVIVGGVPSKAASEAKLLDVKARREEMRLAKEEGRLIPVEQIEPAWLRIAETVKNRVLTLPPAAREAIPHLAVEDVKVLDRLCREALEELSQCPASKI